MPELPEVETTRLGLLPHLRDQIITHVQIRHFQLRYPIATDLPNILYHQQCTAIERRGKYLLFHFNTGCLLVHLGMSGSLRLITEPITLKKHDHVIMTFSNELVMCFHDPRRFGLILWLAKNAQHFLLDNLGVEPLSKQFSAQYLFEQTRQRKIAIKSLIMNSNIVTGVGNIYAAEALFHAKISPLKMAAKLTLNECAILVKQIKKILQQAIKNGGTTLRDFLNSSGKPGYFQQKLYVYGRENEKCKRCKNQLKSIRLNQRSSVYCPLCQAD